MLRAHSARHSPQVTSSQRVSVFAVVRGSFQSWVGVWGQGAWGEASPPGKCSSGCRVRAGMRGCTYHRAKVRGCCSRRSDRVLRTGCREQGPGCRGQGPGSGPAK